MATLDELLALLPDNNSGEISAADMRQVVTDLWQYTANVQGALNEVVVSGLPAAQNAIGALDTRVTALEGSGFAGEVDGSTGELVSGPEGWTATRDSTGVYTVTHGLNVGADAYSVAVTELQHETQVPVVAGVLATTPTSFTFGLATPDGTPTARWAGFVMAVNR